MCLDFCGQRWSNHLQLYTSTPYTVYNYDVGRCMVNQYCMHASTASLVCAAPQGRGHTPLVHPPPCNPWIAISMHAPDSWTVLFSTMQHQGHYSLKCTFRGSEQTTSSSWGQSAIFTSIIIMPLKLLSHPRKHFRTKICTHRAPLPHSISVPKMKGHSMLYCRPANYHALGCGNPRINAFPRFHALTHGNIKHTSTERASIVFAQLCMGLLATW